MPPPSRMRSAPSGGFGMPRRRGRARTRRRSARSVPTTMRFVAASSCGARSIRSPRSEQDERHGVRHAAEGAREDGVDDVAEGAGDAPPLAGRDDDGERDEGEAEAVATVLGLEVRGAVADPADGSAGQVRPCPSRCRGWRAGAEGARHRAACREPRLACGGCRAASVAGRVAVRRTRTPDRVDEARAMVWTDGSPWSHGTRRSPRNHASHAFHWLQCAATRNSPERSTAVPRFGQNRRSTMVLQAWRCDPESASGGACADVRDHLPASAQAHRAPRGTWCVGAQGFLPRQIPPRYRVPSQMTEGPVSCWMAGPSPATLDPGHECQRTAPACWPATLLRGGVLRVTTRPLHRSRRQARTRSRRVPRTQEHARVDRLHATSHADCARRPPQAPRAAPARRCSAPSRRPLPLHVVRRRRARCPPSSARACACRP